MHETNAILKDSFSLEKQSKNCFFNVFFFCGGGSRVFIFPTISLSAIFLPAFKISPRSFYLINYLFMLTAFYWRQFQFENEETTIFPLTSTADKYKHDGDGQNKCIYEHGEDRHERK